MFKIKNTAFIVLTCLACQPNEASLQSTIEAFNEAYMQADIEKLSLLTTKDYVHSNASWKSFGKEKWLEYMNDRRRKIKDGKLQVLDYKMDQLDIAMHENTAIVTARIISQVKEDGELQTKKFRVTHFWKKENGNWKRAGFHDSKIESD